MAALITWPTKSDRVACEVRYGRIPSAQWRSMPVTELVMAVTDGGIAQSIQENCSGRTVRADY